MGLRGTTLGGVTGPDGRFAIDGVPPETYVLQASLVGYQTIQREVEVRAGAATKRKGARSARFSALPRSLPPG